MCELVKVMTEKFDGSCSHIRGAWKLFSMCASPRTFVPSLYRASTDALILDGLSV